MFGSIDRIILMGTRVEMARYVVVDPFDDDISDAELAFARGHNELLRQLRQDSYCDVADAISA